ncbi:MAG: hypothetical protein M1840_007781 [Geoglossum simile]|nr:MAG: hypothetical protein M1840_007781 [Geoglossum simile]
MLQNPKPTTFRACNICPETDAESIKTAILKEAPDENQTIDIVVALVPSCTGSGESQTALIHFTPHPPRFLNQLPPGGEDQLKVDNTDVNIDRDFFGLTQLYSTGKTKIVADIVAVTGLDGHAYGSWRGRGRYRRMWLQDFLAEDLPNCRTMIYGYNSKLQSHGIHSIRDYSRDFLNELKAARRSQEERERPIIFIGHSFGGIIIAQVRSLGKAKQDGIRSIVQATYAVVFFGTPHRGLFNEDLISIIQTERENLLREINQTVNHITPELENFINLAAQLEILSFYETRQTRRIVKGEDGSLSRTGEYVTFVNQDSALLNLPENLEKKIPVENDHSDMVKFNTRSDRTYVSVLDQLRKYLEAAPGAIAERLKREFANVSLSMEYSRDLQDLDHFLREVGFSSQILQGDPREVLTQAAAKGRLGAVRLLLEKANPNFQGKNGETPLTGATKHRHGEVVSLLLEKGAHPTMGSRDGTTPLHAASSKGYTELVKLLLEKRADPNAKENNWDSTPLHEAALSRGADPDKSGDTPLHCAAYAGHDSVVRILVEQGADKEARGNGGATPLYEAASRGHVNVVRYLLETGADLRAKTEEGRTVVEGAEKGGWMNVVRLLEEGLAGGGQAGLRHVVHQGDIFSVKIF